MESIECPEDITNTFMRYLPELIAKLNLDSDGMIYCGLNVDSESVIFEPKNSLGNIEDNLI